MNHLDDPHNTLPCHAAPGALTGDAAEAEERKREEAEALDLMPLCPCPEADPPDVSCFPAGPGQRSCLAPLLVQSNESPWLRCTRGHLYRPLSADRHGVAPEWAAAWREARASERRGGVLVRGALAGWRPEPPR